MTAKTIHLASALAERAGYKSIAFDLGIDLDGIAVWARVARGAGRRVVK
jgi:hypothetical protein